MTQFPVTCSNAYVEGFVKTCADLNLDAHTTATLLQTRQRDELFEESPAYRDGFKSAMVKQAGPFGAIGKGIDWLGGGLLKGMGVAGKGLWKAKAPLGIAGGLGGIGLGAKSLYDTHQKGKAFDALNLFTPDSAKSDSLNSSGSASKGPFDYLNSINRSSPTSAGPDATGPTSFIPKFKEQLSGLSSQEAELRQQMQNGQPMERLHASKMLPAIQAQRNSLQAHFNSMTSGLQADQDRMHSSAATALKTTGDLIPKYTSQFNDSFARSQGGGNFFSRLFHGGQSGSQREAESAAAMLEKLKQVQEQASINANRQLL